MPALSVIFLIVAVAALGVLLWGIFRLQKGKRLGDEEEKFRGKQLMIAGGVGLAIALIIFFTSLLLRPQRPPVVPPPPSPIVEEVPTLLRPALIRPDHCYNGKKDEDEAQVDCGGQACGACEGQACRRNDDCAAALFCSFGACRISPLGAGPGKVSPLSPEISFLDPKLGRVSDYITIFGRNFGLSGKVIFTRGREAKEGSFDFPEVCRKGWWSDRAVVVKVPDLPQGTAEVKVSRSDGKESNAGIFRITSGETRPGLCLIDPSSGPAGIDVLLGGERFGDEEGEVQFFDRKKAVLTRWSATRIEAQVPEGAKSGPVQALAQGIFSNKLPYDVRDCREQECGFGLSCCPDGSCRTREGCKNALPKDAYVWGFTTLGKLLSAGSRCERNEDCLSGRCDREVCSGTLPPGSPCRSNEQCLSLVCLNGFCTGLTPPGSPCTRNEECQSGICENGSCANLPPHITAVTWPPHEIGISWPVHQAGITWPQALAPLSLLSTNPSGNQINVCRNALITITLNQPLEENTVSPNVIFENEVAIEVFNREQGTNRWSDIFLSPREPLDANKTFEVTVRGGAGGLRSLQGAFLPSDVHFRFKTGSAICRISTVSLAINPEPHGRVDLFTCAGRDTCLGDQSAAIPGNQHQYRAQARDAFGNPLVAAYSWLKKHDEGEIIKLEGQSGNEVFVTPNPESGQATIEVKAEGFSQTDGSPDPRSGEGEQTQEVEVFLCENPWPTPQSFPFQDPSTNFSFFYCRDRGNPGSEDDLPALRIVPVPSPADPRVLKEFLFPVDVPGSREAIGVKVMRNPEHFSPRRWYKTTIAPERQGTPVIITIDGYQALREGTTTYISSANISHPNDFFTNMYIVGYTGGRTVSPELSKIWQELLAHIRFNINVDPEDKPAVLRDTKRLGDLSDIDERLALERTATGRFPRLQAGTFIAGITTSRWPSWQQTLGRELKGELPVDPANSFGSCPGFDSATCWNESEKRFAGRIPEELPPGSLVYAYKVLDSEGFRYTLCAIMETGYRATGESLHACPQSSSRLVGRGGIGVNRPPLVFTGPLPVLTPSNTLFYIQAIDPDGDAIVWEPAGTITTSPSVRGFTASSSGSFTLTVRDDFSGVTTMTIPVQVIP